MLVRSIVFSLTLFAAVFCGALASKALAAPVLSVGAGQVVELDEAISPAIAGQVVEFEQTSSLASSEATGSPAMATGLGFLLPLLAGVFRKSLAPYAATIVEEVLREESQGQGPLAAVGAAKDRLEDKLTDPEQRAAADEILHGLERFGLAVLSHETGVAVSMPSRGS